MQTPAEFMSEVSYINTIDEEGIIFLLSNNHDVFHYLNKEKQTDAICIKAVELDWKNLKYVVNKTKDICLVAFKNNSKAEQYIPKDLLDDNDVLLSILEEKPSYIENINNPTKEMMLLAVSKNGLLLKYCDGDDADICLRAVMQNPSAIMHVNDQTKLLQLIAVANDGLNIRYINNPTSAAYVVAINNNGHSIKFIENRTEYMCMTAVMQNGHSIQYIKNKTYRLCRLAYKENEDAAIHIKPLYVFMFRIINFFKK